MADRNGAATPIKIRSIVCVAISQSDLDRRLALLEESGSVVSVSVTRLWYGWQGEAETARMDAVIVHRSI